MRSRIPIVYALFLAACTQTSTSPPVPATKSLNPKQVTRLELAKIDALTSDRWTATLERKGPRETDWEITSTSVEKALADRKANGTFILHLLDALGSLDPVGEAPRGPLESFGLQPPRFALRWTQGETTGEIQLGTLASGRGQSGVYALLPGSKNVQIVRGSALKLLDLITGFESIRYRRWSTIDTDDVDEVELKPTRKKLNYVQRAGVDWQDKAGKPVKGDVNAWLEKLTTLESVEILDQESAEPFEATRELTIKDRRGNPIVFRIRKSKDGRILGLVSSRPGALFQLPESTWSLFESF